MLYALRDDNDDDDSEWVTIGSSLGGSTMSLSVTEARELVNDLQAILDSYDNSAG